jgi:hypothetical protein
MEKIISIEEIEYKENEINYGGFEIKTDKQSIKLLIDNDGQCCESWGYFMSEDDFTDFIGENILDISITDSVLNTKKLADHVDIESEYFWGNIIFVNIITTNGVLQFTAYNDHNGYYGHEAKIISQQLNHDEML